MSAIPQGVLYLPVMAVWITLAGALINRDRMRVVAPLVVAAVTAVIAAVANMPWLLVPVVLLWLLGLLTMVREHRGESY
ncbi:hypothetical protein [Prauserella cavernicola]|uniref:Uncharacterized protein n=1 Tax=Prauserella cavernicola TaxID=2800127 RepID=A0A934QR66_9PSEU|nr:hypothetical protein [Prauserella cavernicola]MBK1783899.1 hypothetical protein [Prauserella cavernicola]